MNHRGRRPIPWEKEGREGGNDDEDERVEEFVDLRTFHPKPNVTWKCGS